MSTMQIQRGACLRNKTNATDEPFVLDVRMDKPTTQQVLFIREDGVADTMSLAAAVAGYDVVDQLEEEDVLAEIEALS